MGGCGSAPPDGVRWPTRGRTKSAPKFRRQLHERRKLSPAVEPRGPRDRVPGFDDDLRGGGAPRRCATSSTMRSWRPKL